MDPSGTGGKILKTNNGITWVTDITTPYPVRKFYFGGSVLYGIGDGGIVVKNSNVTGIDEIKNEAIKLYPNPSGGMIYADIKEKTSISFYSVDGTLVKSVILQPGEFIDLHEMANGIYFTEFRSENNFGKGKLVLMKE